MEKPTKTLRLTKLLRTIQQFFFAQQRIGGKMTETGLPLFWYELLTHPKQVGAWLPSSKALSRAVAKTVDLKHSGYILELGAGTGVITAALLQHGVPPDRLLVIERSNAMVRHLRRKFPQLRIIQGNAEDAKTYLGSEWGNIQHVISGLPLCSLPQSSVQALMALIKELTSAGACYTHFTYNLSRHFVHQVNFLESQHRQLVLRNIPFAVVETFKKN